MRETIRTFAPDSPGYEEVFRLFVAHTDQKIRAQEWVDAFISKMPSRQIYVDVGAGEGSLTSKLMCKFNRPVAIEPNPQFCAKLNTISGIEVIEDSLENIAHLSNADLVLCSHVVYWWDESQWLLLARKMVSWLSGTGTLLIAAQNRDTDCQDMVAHFFGIRTDLTNLFRALKSEWPHFEVRKETVPCQITAPQLEIAYRISEFLLSGQYGAILPSTTEVKTYLDRFREEKGTYRLSCDQDFLLVGPHNSGA